MDDLLADFLTETSESLTALDTAVVRLEHDPEDDHTLSLIFRLMHTIKGTCGFIGLPRLERVAHAGENVLARIRDKLLPATPATISIVLEALDRLRAIVAALAATGREPPGDDATLIAALDAIAEGRAPTGAPAPPLDLARAERLEAPLEPQAGVPTIRVGVDVLDDLMTLVGELVLTRNQLLQLDRSIDGRPGETGAFTVPLQRLSNITSDLQEGVLKTRMQPIGNAWSKLPRLVRDIARELGKTIELRMVGAETELDRQVLELIRDPLTHMVRNSADHGVEGPAERRAAGKSETGRITLNAFHEGGHIIVELSDDGRGLALDRIRAKALAQGLATEAEIAGMSDARLHRFIFGAGFSTAADVTAISGRGVGLDVVKTNIERIGGTIELNSVPGQGTTFIIKIPLTLAIVSALIVAVGGERFAIPRINVIELAHARSGRAPSDLDGAGAGAMIEDIDGTSVLRLRERLLPLVRLDALLQLDAEGRDADDGERTIVVAQVGASQLGIVVDRAFDTEEIVVKPMTPILRHMTLFSGNTILGDGSVIMILDPIGIARAAGVAGEGDARAIDDAAIAAEAADPDVALLLFRAGGRDPMAVPLALVARLEEIEAGAIETSSGNPVIQYRGRLMPLVPLSGALDPERPRHPVLVFIDADGPPGADRRMGLVVDEIVDVVEDKLDIQLCCARAGLLGTAIIAGRASDVIDTGYWLTQAHREWFNGARAAVARGSQILVVEDSDFFRQLLVPILDAAGYQVRAVGDPTTALQLRDAGVMFDAIIADIATPESNGIEFVRAIRGDDAWRSVPVIALGGRATADDILAARDAGFTDIVATFERDSVLASLAQCIPRRAPRRHGAAALAA
jgi:two-component system chemotaxis sensor kinase CheA